MTTARNWSPPVPRQWSPTKYNVIAICAILERGEYLRDKKEVAELKKVLATFPRGGEDADAQDIADLMQSRGFSTDARMARAIAKRMGVTVMKTHRWAGVGHRLHEMGPPYKDVGEGSKSGSKCGFERDNGGGTDRASGDGAERKECPAPEVPAHEDGRCASLAGPAFSDERTRGARCGAGGRGGDAGEGAAA